VLMVRDNITLTGARTSGVKPRGLNDGIGKEYLPDSEREPRSQSGTMRKVDANCELRCVCLGAGLSNSIGRKAPSDRSALKP